MVNLDIFYVANFSIKTPILNKKGKKSHIRVSGCGAVGKAIVSDTDGVYYMKIDCI